MKKLLFILPLLISGCLATENRQIPMTCRGIAAVNSEGIAQPWWRTPYYASDKYKSPWDAFVPAPTQDPLEAELEFFRHNVVRWPKEMPAPFVPERSAPKTKPEPVTGEVY